MTNLDELVKQAYDLFANYPLKAPLSVCYYCCLTKEEETILLKTPLKRLNGQELNYYLSAAQGNDTERTVAEMKYFLPRIMELLSACETVHYISEECLFQRLYLNERQYWRKQEQALIEQFALAYFERYLNGQERASVMSADVILIMFDAGGVDVTPLLNHWRRQKSVPNLLLLYQLVTQEIKYVMGSPKKLCNAFSTPEFNERMISWLSSPKTTQSVLQTLTNHLENNRKLTEDELERLFSLHDFMSEIYTRPQSIALL